MGERQHLHRDDYPQALYALHEVVAARSVDADGLVAIGYQPSDHGVWVDWDQLGRSWLSSTEKAAVVVARGLAMAECQGGFSPRIRAALLRAMETM